MKKTENLLAWRAFLVAADTGSMSRAGLILGMDAPAISRLVSDLEQDLGYPLLDRSKRPFVLTDKGRYVSETVGPHEAAIREALGRLDDDNHSILTVAAPTDLNQCFIHDQLIRYSDTHRGVQFYLQSSCPAEDVLSGRVDVALIDRPAITSNQLVVRFCVQPEAVPLASVRYVEQHGYPRTPDDLKDHRGLLLRQGLRKMTSFLFDRAGHMSPMLRWKSVFMTDAQLTLNHMLLDDKGVVIDCVPHHLTEQLRAGLLVPVLPGWRRKPQELCIVTRRDREAMSDVLHDFALWWKNEYRRTALARVEEGEQLMDEIIRQYSR